MLKQTHSLNPGSLNVAMGCRSVGGEKSPWWRMKAGGTCNRMSECQGGSCRCRSVLKSRKVREDLSQMTRKFLKKY